MNTATNQDKQEATRFFGQLSGYTGTGNRNGKIVIHVNDTKSACAKAEIPQSLRGKVEISGPGKAQANPKRALAW